MCTQHLVYMLMPSLTDCMHDITSQVTTWWNPRWPHFYWFAFSHVQVLLGQLALLQDAHKRLLDDCNILRERAHELIEHEARVLPQGQGIQRQISSLRASLHDIKR